MDDEQPYGIFYIFDRETENNLEIIALYGKIGCVGEIN